MALCLVVEDAPEQRRNLVALLDSEGHETATAETAVAARRIVQQRRPELILLDLGLPDADGLDLLPELLASSPLVRVIVLTGRDSVRSAVRALQAGARHYLVKPWEMDELRVVVEREARAAAFAESEIRKAGSTPYWGEHEAMRALRSSL